MNTRELTVAMQIPLPNAYTFTLNTHYGVEKLALLFNTTRNIRHHQTRLIRCLNLRMILSVLVPTTNTLQNTQKYFS